MKSLLIFLIGCLTVISSFAQNPVVTIRVNNRVQEVLIDGKSYPVTTSATSGTDYNIVMITDLQPGQHELQVVRNQNSNTRRNNTRTFNLRARYVLAITMYNDGTVELKETRNRNRGNVYNQSRTPMTDANFSSLLNNVQSQTRANAKRTAIRNALTNTNNYFTTSQAGELIESVNSEPNRLEFAKLAYPRITDPGNASQLYDLFNNQSNRDALSAYITSYNNNNPGYSNNNNGYNNNNNANQYKTAMTEANFNVIMQNVKKQWLPGAKMSALTDAFNNTSNYFTTYQAKQLIQLVSDEDNRLQLAKLAYRNIVDPSNFTQLYDLFTTQARRDALANYVSSYSYNRY
jgi:type II secretory pathway pseudopilin PulG